MRGWPRSLAGRNLLLLLALLAASQLLAAVIFRHYVQQPRVAALVNLLADHLVSLEAGISALPARERESFVAAFNRKAQAQPGNPAAHPNAPFERLLLQAVSTRLAQDGMAVTWRAEAGGGLFVRLEVAGRPYWLATSGMNLSLSLPKAALVLWLFTFGLAALGAFLLARRVNRPLARLAQAAAKLGRGMRPVALPVEGPAEIAHLSQAFNRMGEELARRDQDRSLMLAGISHDLRTPLAKLRLAMEMLPAETDPAISESMLRSSQQMASLVERFIDFARHDREETPQLTDLAALVQEAVATVPGGESVALDLPPSRPRWARRAALGRLVSNLVDNALRYGHPPVQVILRDGAEGAELAVRDAGAGMSPDRAERLRRPFVRGDEARGGTVGTGLGLAIADRIAQVEGGHLVFSHPPEGGFEVLLRLPRERRGPERSPSA